MNPGKGKFKLLSDFDGVWTNQNIEAEYVSNYIIDSVSELSTMSKDETKDFFFRCRKEMDKEPLKYGWVNNRMVACFYGEDPYGDNNAIFEFINKASDNHDDPEFRNLLLKVKRSVLTKFDRLSDFSQECFSGATGKFKSEGNLNPIKQTKEIVDKLNQLNTEVVVASNSTTQKIEYLFSKAAAKVKARGDAKKFVIFNSYSSLPEFLEINSEVRVPLRRASYHAILIEEVPDFVIGDVFSLDLSLPLHLRMKDKNFGNLKVIQRVQPYTPKWVKDYLSRKEFDGVAFMIESMDELTGIIERS